MEQEKVCFDCLKPILPTDISQYFTGTKRWYHHSCYQAWSLRMIECAVQDYGIKRERRTA